MNPDSPLVVIKVGGSLLDWSGLPSRLADLLAARGDVRTVLIAGGGKLADVLRDLDTVHSLGERRSHALAVRVLDTTAHILSAILPGTRVVTSLDELTPTWRTGVRPILAPRLVLDEDERRHPLSALPHTWSTTSDSISARIARILGASELVVLKSVTPPPDMSLSGAAALGLIDAEFPSIARDLPLVSCINLRGTALSPTILHRRPGG
jgi:aspartokinase-like uncharacterized kinase